MLWWPTYEMGGENGVKVWRNLKNMHQSSRRCQFPFCPCYVFFWLLFHTILLLLYFIITSNSRYPFLVMLANASYFYGFLFLCPKRQFQLPLQIPYPSKSTASYLTNQAISKIIFLPSVFVTTYFIFHRITKKTSSADSRLHIFLPTPRSQLVCFCPDPHLIVTSAEMTLRKPQFLWRHTRLENQTSHYQEPKKKSLFWLFAIGTPVFVIFHDKKLLPLNIRWQKSAIFVKARVAGIGRV